MFRRVTVLSDDLAPAIEALAPATRALILNQFGGPSDGFLDTVVAICQTHRIAPVVLTVAGSERQARIRERFMADAFAQRGLIADFDFVTGWDVPTAVARAAQWRRCSHVFVERRAISLWQRWLFGDIMGELSGLSDSLTLVAVPETPFPAHGLKR
jgi:hypothetical protein